MESSIPESRVRVLNAPELDAQGRYVLYWMTGHRRTDRNFALQRAVEWALELGRGLVVLEALRCDYEWASDRLHRFVLDGMQDNLAALRGRAGVTYYPFVERSAGEGRGLLAALAMEAAVVVTDDFPAFFIPRMLDAAARRLERTRLEAVDSNGLAPIRGTSKAYPTAYSFRRYLQKNLPGHLQHVPERDPVGRLQSLPAPVVRTDIPGRWPSAEAELGGEGIDVGKLPIDHSVGATGLRGGPRAAETRLDTFVNNRLAHYENRNQPEEEMASGLSPYLHFGHISTHEVLARLADREDWRPSFEDRPASGKRSGWWGMSEPAEAFLDQLVTWRELGFNMAASRSDYREFGSLPDWARETLEAHAGDTRPHLYGVEQLESAATHDDLWNAAQRQLRREGAIHNYLRMLWGKKILEWTATPEEAARVMIELNNRYALDGRDPNSYSGIYWCLGRYDRPWGPERPVFGKIRYMTSANTARKLKVKGYIARYSDG